MLLIFQRIVSNRVEPSTLTFIIILSRNLDKIINLEHITIGNQLVDIFTKALDVNQFEKLRGAFGIFICENYKNQC